MEVFKSAGIIAALVVSCISILVSLSKGGASLVSKIFAKNAQAIIDKNDEQSKDIKCIKENIVDMVDKVTSISNKVSVLEESAKQQHRDAIKEIYYKYRDKKIIPLYERKAADLNYTIYSERYNGNSYIQLLYEEICKWNLIEE